MFPVLSPSIPVYCECKGLIVVYNSKKSGFLTPDGSRFDAILIACAGLESGQGCLKDSMIGRIRLRIGYNLTIDPDPILYSVEFQICRVAWFFELPTNCDGVRLHILQIRGFAEALRKTRMTDSNDQGFLATYELSKVGNDISPTATNNSNFHLESLYILWSILFTTCFAVPIIPET